MKIQDLAVDERKDRLTGVGARAETLACLKIQNAQHVLYFWKVGGVKYINYDIPVCQMKDTQRDKMAWTSFTIVFNILICVVVLKITHNINTCKDHGISYHFSKAPRCPTDAIFYCILVVLSIRSTAVLYYKLKVQLGKWDNNLTLSYNRFSDAGSVSNYAVAASHKLWILPLATNGDWVF